MMTALLYVIPVARKDLATLLAGRALQWNTRLPARKKLNVESRTGGDRNEYRLSNIRTLVKSVDFKPIAVNATRYRDYSLETLQHHKALKPPTDVRRTTLLS